MRLFFLCCLLLGASLARAQQPAALPGAPQVPPTPAALPPPGSPTGAEPSTADGPAELIGRSYSVELNSGTSFLGVLQATTAQSLTFATSDLGTVTVQRVNLRQLTLLTPDQARRGFNDVGNGNRLLFAPTARNLRRGEGYVQSAYVFLVGVNYGITDNFSLGTLFTFVPSAGSDNFFSLTPKVSVPVRDDLRLGGGAILGIANGGTFGVTYANGTYGSADNNLTLGLGYGFADGAFSSTPVFLLGGAKRVSRRVSLMSETYFLRTEDGYSRQNLAFGIAGLRVSAQRLSGGLGVLYAIYSETRNNSYGGSRSSSDSGALPYAEVSYRFGKLK